MEDRLKIQVPHPFIKELISSEKFQDLKNFQGPRKPWAHTHGQEATPNQDFSQ